MAPVRLLAFFCICLLISSVSAIIVSRSELNRDGYISDESHLPNCTDGRRIKLLSYSYEFECGTQTCSKAPDEQLSISAVAVIHRMCSLKLKCAKQESSLLEIQENIKVYLKISYSCLGLFDTFVNICENATTTSVNTKPIHLKQETNYWNPKRFEKCECSVRGRFQLTLADVRLRSAADPNRCSPAQLRVNSKTYECDQMASTVGSVFNKTAIGTLTDETILYTTNSAIEEPEMIYLTVEPVEPEGQQTEVSCIHYPRFISPNTIELMQTEEIATDLNKYSQEKDVEHPVYQMNRASVDVFVVLCVVVGLTVLSLVVSVIANIVLVKRLRALPLQTSDARSTHTTSGEPLDTNNYLEVIADPTDANNPLEISGELIDANNYQTLNEGRNDERAYSELTHEYENKIM